MYIACQKYPTMPGEPHLGHVTECELIADQSEVLDLIAEAIEDSGEFPICVYGIDDYSDEQIELEVNDWVDDTLIEEMNQWLEDRGDENFPAIDEINEKLKELS
jgi:predicted house-cleaning noncanonical NTP pyrophosphatase (MazG superfamily)